MSQVTLTYSPRGRDGRFAWGRKDEEFIADFTLLAKRRLDELEYRIFRYHFLLGADWRLCCRRLDMDRGNFFHSVYRVMTKLGRVFRETEPYGLYPIDEYFSTTVSGVGPCGVSSQPAGHPVSPPLREAA